MKNWLTWDQNSNSSLHSFSDYAVQCKHPMRLDVMISENFIDLATENEIQILYPPAA